MEQRPAAGGQLRQQAAAAGGGGGRAALTFSAWSSMVVIVRCTERSALIAWSGAAARGAHADGPVR